MLVRAFEIYLAGVFFFGEDRHPRSAGIHPDIEDVGLAEKPRLPAGTFFCGHKFPGAFPEAEDARRQLAQIELIAAIDRGGSTSKIADAELAMAEAAVLEAAGLYSEAVNAYKTAWADATKA